MVFNKHKMIVSEQIIQHKVSSTMYISVFFVIVICQSKLNHNGIMCNHISSFSNISPYNRDNRAAPAAALSPNPSSTSGWKSLDGGDSTFLGNKESKGHHKTKRRNDHDRHRIQRLYSGNHKQGRRARAVYLAVEDSKKLNSSSLSSSSQLFSSNSMNHSSPSSSYQNDQPPVLDQCCACDEAKYELVFEGLWSRYTHPDDFPENYWLAYFSDIIGASHSNEFRMWQQDSHASEGVKELAETGSTKKLESELKQVSSKTRTIIKARELHYPTLNSKTSAVFRTDRQHHLASILSKLGPSPDWMVGVSGLELCQSDCSWASQRVVNLYLWDAGTDSGATFTAPDSPTKPPDKIHPFRKVTQVASQASTGNGASTTRRPDYGMGYESSNNNYQRRSYEFQSQFGGSLNPQQQQQQDQSSNGGNNNNNAAMTDLYNQEQFKPYARLTITRQRIYEKSCNADSLIMTMRPPGTNQTNLNPEVWTAEPTQPPYADCHYTDWSDWSACSITCGKGIRTRTRSFVDEQAHLAGCPQVDLIKKEICHSECIGNVTCITRDWSEWSECSVTCGQGFRKRTRSPIGILRKACESIDYVQTESCTGSHSSDCQADSASCQLSEWSQWSECSVACGKGTRIRTRHFLRKEDMDNCTAKLIQKSSCHGRAELCQQAGSSGPSANQHLNPQSNPNLPVIDCKLSPWGPWSTCSALCGNGKRIRSRYIIQMPQNGGKPCDKKLSRTQKCKNLPACPPNYHVQQEQQNSPSGPNARRPMRPSGTGGNKQSGSSRNHDWQTTSTTQGSSMLDDEDDTDETSAAASSSSSSSSLPDLELIAEDEREVDKPCEYGDWTQWSECEVVCQPVKKGSNKVRQRHPVDTQNNRCGPIEELYYCDPNIYC